MGRKESGEIIMIEEGLGNGGGGSAVGGKLSLWASPATVTILQKVFAEMMGTYILIFMGCGSVAVNKIYGEVTLLGVATTWGLTVTALVYSLGHVSGAHFNPSVTIAFALLRRFPCRQVPLYIIAQILGSLFASVTLSLSLDITGEAFFGTVPNGPLCRSLVFEIVTTFLLMLVICGASTDSRANGGLAGIAVGMTILLDVLVAGRISGASMNPARTLGPALVKHVYTGLWIYMVGPIVGAIAGGLAYNLLRDTDKSLTELTKIGNIS